MSSSIFLTTFNSDSLAYLICWFYIKVSKLSELPVASEPPRLRVRPRVNIVIMSIKLNLVNGKQMSKLFCIIMVAVS